MQKLIAYQKCEQNSIYIDSGQSLLNELITIEQQDRLIQARNAHGVSKHISNWRIAAETNKRNSLHATMKSQNLSFHVNQKFNQIKLINCCWLKLPENETIWIWYGSLFARLVNRWEEFEKKIIEENPLLVIDLVKNEY